MRRIVMWGGCNNLYLSKSSRFKVLIFRFKGIYKAIFLLCECLYCILSSIKVPKKNNDQFGKKIIGKQVTLLKVEMEYFIRECFILFTYKTCKCET
jgi:hypothetical protein